MVFHDLSVVKQDEKEGYDHDLERRLVLVIFVLQQDQRWLLGQADKASVLNEVVQWAEGRHRSSTYSATAITKTDASLTSVHLTPHSS